MNIKHLVFALFFPLVTFSQALADFPQANISNELITAKLLLPDFENGYYQATRFDWSGLISNLEFDGHTYFGKWFKNYDPKSHESVMGPVEAFDPLGYDDAKVGEDFIKIGVGAVTKPEEEKYFFGNSYNITNPGNWQIEKFSNKVDFTHTLNNKQYAYIYKKSVSLPYGEPVLILDHTLTNTGSKTIDTEVFNHNFYMLDSMPIGPGYVIKFPFSIIGDPKSLGKFAEVDNNKIVFINKLEENDHTRIASITGFKPDASDYDIRIENEKSGAGVRITANRPMSQLAYWSSSTTLCPEPYIHVKIEPGETFTWQIKYHYYSL